MLNLPAPLPEPSALRDFRAALRAFTRSAPILSPMGPGRSGRPDASPELGHTPCPAVRHSPPAKASARTFGVRKTGHGPRPWIAVVDQRPLADRLGRPIHYASRAAALLAATGHPITVVRRV